MTTAPPAGRSARKLAIALALALLWFGGSWAWAQGSWSGDFVLTIKGSGVNEVAVAPLPGGKARMTWAVERSARGRIVLDRMFKGAGIARTPDSRNTDRYETWVASGAQPLEMVVNDHGTFYGFIPSGHVALDETNYRCPMPDARHPTGQVRSGILQFDRLTGTWSFETGRMIHRCATSKLRTPKHGPPDWLAKAPFDLLSNAFELEFEIWHGLDPLDEFHLMTGKYAEGASELVLSRRFTFNWSSPFTEKAPVHGVLELVLRKSP